MIGKKAIPRAGRPAAGRPAARLPGTTTPRLVAPLAVLAAPALAYLVLRHERLGLLACAGLLLALLALLRPAAALAALIPAGLMEAATTGGSSRTCEATALVTLAVVLGAVTGARPLRPAHLWIGVLAGALIISVRFPAVDVLKTATASDIDGLLGGLALLAAVVAVAPRPSAIVRAIASAGALAAACALAFGEYDGGRLAALGLNPNYLGGLLALPCVAAVGLAGRAGRACRPLWLVPAAACLAAIVATQSRGAFLSAAAGIVVVVVQGRRRRPRARLVLAACATVAVVAVVAPNGGLGLVEQVTAGNRQSADMAYDTAVRGDVAQFAMTVAARHPVRGIGYGVFPAYAAAAPDFGIYMATHDDYLRLAAEAGAIALAAFLVLLWLGTRGRRSGDLAVLRAVTVAYAVGLVFANPLASLLASLPFWLSLGCLLATSPERPPGDTTTKIATTR